MLPRVVLLHDAQAASGRADAIDVLLESQHVARGLETLGYQSVIVPVGLDLEELAASLDELAPVAVFNLMESIAGHGRLIHVVPALLEALSIPYTGCSAFAQWTTSNKLVAKRRLEQGGVATPPLLAAGVRGPEPAPGAGPWIVKSVWEHASLGLDDDSLVAGRREAEALIGERRQRFGGDWFAERYIAGRELNAAIIAADDGPRVLPVGEIQFQDFPPGKPQIVGFAAKWRPDSFEYTRTVRTFDVEPELCAEAARIALRCWDLFDLGGYARVDFRVDERGRPWVLEVNANPCLSADAGFAAMLETAGIAFRDALAWLIDEALAKEARPAACGTP
jgi:D-alanine-D-alanine ligase